MQGKHPKEKDKHVGRNYFPFACKSGMKIPVCLSNFMTVKHSLVMNSLELPVGPRDEFGRVLIRLQPNLGLDFVKADIWSYRFPRFKIHGLTFGFAWAKFHGLADPNDFNFGWAWVRGVG